MFIANVRVTADEYSGTFLHRQPLSSTVSHSCDVTPHQTVFFIEPQISAVHLHSSTVYCHSVTAAVELTEQNKMYSAAAFHCTDRQCIVEPAWCWCY